MSNPAQPVPRRTRATEETNIRRRNLVLLLGGGLIAWPRAARAERKSVIGFLSGAEAEPYAPLVAAFRQGLADTGRDQAKDVEIEFRWAQGRYDRLPTLASQLVFGRASVIVASGGDVVTLAAKSLTSTIPIVFADGADPVTLGFVANFQSPERNITGVSVFSLDMEAMRLNLLRELLPGATVVAMLVNPENPIPESNVIAFGMHAQTHRLLIVTVRASSERDLETAFASASERGAGALLVAGDAFFNSRRGLLAALAARHALPAIYAWREFAEAGGLMSYGPALKNAYREAGSYTAQILAGATPADMPVLRQTRAELIVNLATAKRLGLKMPASILARADDVIR